MYRIATPEACSPNIQQVIAIMWKLLDKVPVGLLAIVAVMLGIAPLGSQPHLLEKLGMLMNGTLVKPIDIFDLVLHSIFSVLLLIKILRIVVLRNKKRESF